MSVILTDIVVYNVSPSVSVRLADVETTIPAVQCAAVMCDVVCTVAESEVCFTSQWHMQMVLRASLFLSSSVFI